MDEDDRKYRELIDALVHQCKEGQGRIAARRAREGVWNKNATAKTLPEQHRVNVLLKALTPEQRDVLADVLAEQFQGGVHQTLVTLHESEVKPFDKAYEGTPFHDFIGRLTDWAWPEDTERS
jgi:hypothetical protein